MKIIYTRKGEEILVDDEDYEDLSQFTWHLSNGYPTRGAYCAETGRKYTESMHRRVMGLKHGDPRKVDHRFGNKLDARKAELRICNNAQNMWNIPMLKNNTSGYRGVKLKGKGRNGKERGSKKWETRIAYNGKNHYLGCFETAEEAYEFYCLAADMLHGEFAAHRNRGTNSSATASESAEGGAA
jgi:hypothetical protein